MDDPTVSITSPEPGRAAPGPVLHSWGPFLLIERVGQGGFGEVYRARDLKLDREVAVKLLRTSSAPAVKGEDPDYSAVLREARLIAKVRHPNVVSVYGVERYDGRVGFWSDFVKGKTLADLLQVQGAFGAREAAAIGIELCRALSAMHSVGLLHRDIKASNAMREEGGRILLMDFGLSGEVARTGSLSGTPGYMAPELFTGSPPSVATDIYALGVLLFFLSCGRYPAGTQRRLIDQRSDLPEGFVRVVETAIDPDPAKRFSSAGEMLAALSNTVSNSQMIPVQVTQNRTKWIAGVIAGVLLFSAAGYLAKRPTRAAGLTGAAGANEDYVTAEKLLQREDKPENVTKAITLFGKTIGADPKFALGHSGLARAYRLEYLTTKFPDFLVKAKAEGQTALALDNSLAPIHVTMGLIYTTATGQNAIAANELQQALHLDSTSAEAYAALAKLYAAQNRSAADVAPSFQKAIDLGPDDWRWPNQFGGYLLTAGKYAEAAEQFQRVVRIVPDNSYGFINLGISYRGQERYAEAENAFRQALKLNPQSAPALTGLANVLLIQGKYPEAAIAYQKAVEFAPADFVTRGNLAVAYQLSPGDKGKARLEYLAAIELAEKARSEQPRKPSILANLGAYYAAVGDQTRALPLLRQALALSPEEPGILVLAGEGFELAGHRKEAVESISKALDLGYSAKFIERSPELADLRKDPKYLARSARLR
jgi:eukaryotic-like serine/threonine-protein kinase